MPHTRPNPDELLAQVQAEEARTRRGRLKIFLGYAAGVGKTFNMLDAAHLRRAEGVDVVIGYVETHCRAETEAMVEGLEVVPRKQIEYRGTTLPEMDVDAVLARKPQLALVDELAHTNAPGSRHPKRFQDALELLEAGIDVYTTLNIQHIESLNDVVAQITGVIVRETVPDRVLDEANEIELIDLPPDELLQRLRDGKIYLPEQAARAIQKWFRPGNLAALREIAMRRAADRVDEQLRAYMQVQAISGPWAAGERLLVCLSPSPLSERLIRATKRLATSLNAEWIALYVETPAQARMSEADRDRVARTMQLAEELGATVVNVPGANVADMVVQYARAHNVTKIVAGKPLRSRWQEALRGSVVNQIIRRSGEIDVYVISGAPEAARPADTFAVQPHRPWDRYAKSLTMVALVTLLGRTFSPFLSPTNIVMPFLLAVVLAAIYLGRGPAILASVAGVLAFDFFFIPPYLTFAISQTQYLITFAAMLTVGLVISNLAVQVRDQAEAARRREAQTAALYALSRDLAVAADLDAIAQAVLVHVGQTFEREVAVLLPEGDRVTARAISGGFRFDDNEYAVATWALQHGKPAGRGTDTLPAGRGRFLPLRTARGVGGVLGVQPRGDDDHPLPPSQRRLLEAFASQLALALERTRLAEDAGRLQLLNETEKLQTALLNSISHDLRTPLASITGALSSLHADETLLDPATRRALVKTAWEEADRLNRLLGNLLDMTRMEAGALKVAAEPGDVQDVIGVALEQVRERLGSRPVQVHVPTDLPLVPMDFVLIAQVLVNVLDNAIKYAPSHQPIEVRARRRGSEVEIEVADRGPGIPPDEVERIFDKFYRVEHPNPAGGTGLGLSICKGIVEAHGGTIRAYNRIGGGAAVALCLPVG